MMSIMLTPPEPLFRKKKTDNGEFPIGNRPTTQKKQDLSDTGVVSGNGDHQSSFIDHQEDSFQRMYSKELDLDEGKAVRC